MNRLTARHQPGRSVPVLVALAGCLLLLAAGIAAADATFTFVDLQPKANQKLADDLHDNQGNNWANLPQGEQKLADVTFKIGEKYVHAKGEHAPDKPEKVEGIKIDAKFDRLHILHSTGYGEGDDALPDGTEIGAYVVHYADGAKERIPIVYGEDLRDWWVNPDHMDLKRAKAAWTGTNPAADQNERKIRAYRIAWDNPHPDKEVATIDVESKVTMCDPFVFALTLEKK